MREVTPKEIVVNFTDKTVSGGQTVYRFFAYTAGTLDGKAYGIEMETSDGPEQDILDALERHIRQRHQS